MIGSDCRLVEIARCSCSCWSWDVRVWETLEASARATVFLIKERWANAGVLAESAGCEDRAAADEDDELCASPARFPEGRGAGRGDDERVELGVAEGERDEDTLERNSERLMVVGWTAVKGWDSSTGNGSGNSGGPPSRSRTSMGAAGDSWGGTGLRMGESISGGESQPRVASPSSSFWADSPSLEALGAKERPWEGRRVVEPRREMDPVLGGFAGTGVRERDPFCGLLDLKKPVELADTEEDSEADDDRVEEEEEEEGILGGTSLAA